ncbi:hypothetical protein BDQ17DRAFT_1355785 [Cyathus striatus]|nr:hypothetical protein BDQ17DRAFT_1355785 [Cyathus striatus]
MRFCINFAPRLSTLRIVENVEGVRPLLSMVRMSSCAITQLQLSLCPSGMLQILKELPTVEVLSLLKRGISHEFIGNLVWASRPDRESNNVLPSLKKLELPAMNHYMEEIPMDCLCCLSYIMTSRSASEARQQTSLSTPLTLIKCSTYVPEGQHEKYEEMFDCLRNVGAEAGIEVELEIGKREYEESKSEGSSSSSLSIRSW